MDLVNAARKGDTAAIKACLAKGADVSAKNNWGDTALSFSRQLRYPEIEQILLKAGAKK